MPTLRWALQGQELHRLKPTGGFTCYRDATF
jgi:hypothetical protein